MSMSFSLGSFPKRRRTSGSTRRASRNRLMMQPWLEGLENRIVLTTNTWTGQAALAHQDYSWSNTDNWSNGKVADGQDLIFPAAGAQTFIPAHAIANDLSGMTFDSIEIDGAGYTIGGDSISLTASTGLFTTYGTGVSAFNINTTLTGGNVAIAGGGELDINGVISGNAGFNLSGGGILGGTGQLSGFTVQDSEVQPGTLGIGSLRLQGGSTFYPNSSFSAELDSATVNSSLASSGGTVVLEAPTLLPIVLAPGYIPTAGSSFTIIQGTISGTFSNDPPGSSVTSVGGGSTFRISYQNGVVLTAVLPTTIQTSVQGGITTSVFGQSLTFTATISHTGGTPTGTVTFEDGGTVLGTGPVPVNASGVATLTTTKLALGPHAITSVYSGDSKFAGSTSPELDVTVNQAGSSTALSSSANPSVFGQSVTFTAKVTAVAPGTGTPTGSVEFFDNGTELSEIDLNGGIATLPSTLSLGSHSITAVYSGDDNFTTSGSAVVSQNVNQAKSTTTLSSSANPSAFGQTVTFTAQVAATAPGTGIPTGSVTFLDGTTELATVALTAAGSASVSTSALTRGSHSITAKYTGDADFLASNSAVTGQNVNQATTQTVVTPSPSASILGQSVTFTAQVSAVSPGAGTPTGSVEFFDGTTDLGPATLFGGAANISTSALTVGSHSITAEYSGDNANYLASTSNPIIQTVGGTTVALVASANPSPFGQSVTFTATVAATAAGSSVPTGSVTFMDGTQTLGSSGVDGSGVASISTASLSGGTHAITAVYGGAAGFAPSTSSETDEIVNPASTTTTLVPSVSQATFGQSVAFKATVTDGTSTPTGTVTFKDGSAVLATMTLDASGTATYTSSALTVGAHSLVATFNGSSSYSPSPSSKLAISVAQAATTTALAGSTSSPAAGQLVTLTATIAPVAPGAGAPTGMVVFHDGSTVIGTAAVSSGQASITVAFSGVGTTHVIEATYQGSDGYVSSNSANQTLTVLNPTATTRLVAKPLFAGKKVKGVTFQIVIQPGSAGLPVPTGRVTLEIGKKKISTVSLSGGSASVNVAKAKASGKTFVVQYLGDTNYKAGKSNSVKIKASFFKAKPTALRLGV
jgi:Bacterial Ig-like domain (group 3)